MPCLNLESSYDIPSDLSAVVVVRLRVPTTRLPKVEVELSMKDRETPKSKVFPGVTWEPGINLTPSLVRVNPLVSRKSWEPFEEPTTSGRITVGRSFRIPPRQ